MRQDITNTVEKHRYVIYDFESDVHTLTHKPNHVEADVLQVDKTTIRMTTVSQTHLDIMDTML